MIYLGADHRGYKLKEYISEYLDDRAIEFEDMGANNEELSDYPIYARKVGNKIAGTENRGILICGSGAGMTIASNKIKGVYAALATNPKMASAIKQQDDVNVLVLAADFTSEEQTKNILDAWLDTEYDRQGRHQKRIDQIKELEKKSD
ncbi:MAG: RpiB/LacA/LacB family sugar-phosphate isomerase [bacterium]